jgi:hypothetical protein
MKRFLTGVAVLILATFFASGPTAAQGPAGAGAAEAAGGGSNARSYNPTKWFGKKDAHSSGESRISVEDLDKKLEPKLRAAQVLGGNTALKDICLNFVERIDCVAALRASHNLGLNFECVKSNITGVRTGVDTNLCRMQAEDKPLSLMKTIRLLKSDVDAKTAAKDAEAAAREDVKDAAS